MKTYHLDLIHDELHKLHEMAYCNNKDKHALSILGKVMTLLKTPETDHVCMCWSIDDVIEEADNQEKQITSDKAREILRLAYERYLNNDSYSGPTFAADVYDFVSELEDA